MASLSSRVRQWLCNRAIATKRNCEKWRKLTAPVAAPATSFDASNSSILSKTPLSTYDSNRPVAAVMIDECAKCLVLVSVGNDLVKWFINNHISNHCPWIIWFCFKIDFLQMLCDSNLNHLCNDFNWSLSSSLKIKIVFWNSWSVNRWLGLYSVLFFLEQMHLSSAFCITIPRLT